MRFAVIICVGLTLSACVDWPDIPGETSQAQDAPWPTLRPLSEVLSGTTGTISVLDGETLAARASALRARADVLRRPVADDAAFEAMRARMAAF